MRAIDQIRNSMSNISAAAEFADMPDDVRQAIRDHVTVVNAFVARIDDAVREPIT